MTPHIPRIAADLFQRIVATLRTRPHASAEQADTQSQIVGRAIIVPLGGKSLAAEMVDVHELDPDGMDFTLGRKLNSGTTLAMCLHAARPSSAGRAVLCRVDRWSPIALNVCLIRVTFAAEIVSPVRDADVMQSIEAEELRRSVDAAA